MPDGYSVHCFGCGAGKREVHAAVGLSGPMDGPPLSDFQQAFAMGRRQAGDRYRREAHVADMVREFTQLVTDLRAEATALGDCDVAWEMLAEIAEHERIVWAATS